MTDAFSQSWHLTSNPTFAGMQTRFYITGTDIAVGVQMRLFSSGGFQQFSAGNGNTERIDWNMNADGRLEVQDPATGLWAAPANYTGMGAPPPPPPGSWGTARLNLSLTSADIGRKITVFDQDGVSILDRSITASDVTVGYVDVLLMAQTSAIDVFLDEMFFIRASTSTRDPAAENPIPLPVTMVDSPIPTRYQATPITPATAEAPGLGSNATLSAPAASAIPSQPVPASSGGTVTAGTVTAAPQAADNSGNTGGGPSLAVGTGGANSASPQDIRAAVRAAIEDSTSSSISLATPAAITSNSTAQAVVEGQFSDFGSKLSAIRAASLRCVTKVTSIANQFASVTLATPGQSTVLQMGMARIDLANFNHPWLRNAMKVIVVIIAMNVCYFACKSILT